jgi:hypothetical protein
MAMVTRPRAQMLWLVWRIPTLPNNALPTTEAKRYCNSWSHPLTLICYPQWRGFWASFTALYPKEHDVYETRYVSKTALRTKSKTQAMPCCVLSSELLATDMLVLFIWPPVSSDIISTLRRRDFYQKNQWRHILHEETSSTKFYSLCEASSCGGGYFHRNLCES